MNKPVDPQPAQVLLTESERKKRYRECLSKANSLIAKEKFGAAKYQLSLAAALDPGQDLQQRIRECEDKAQRLIAAQEFARQGYRMEREKNLPEAIKAFGQSLEEWENKEIRALFRNLQNRLPKPSLGPAQAAESKHNYPEAIKIFREALALADVQSVRNRLGVCLCKAGFLQEAADLWQASRPSDPEGLYYFGWSLAKLGNSVEAVKTWARITDSPADFVAQKERVLRAALSSILRKAGDDAEFQTAYEDMRDILQLDNSPIVTNCFKHLCCDRIVKLWEREDYELIIELLLSQPDDLLDKQFRVIVLAKTFFRMAENQIDRLSDAITYCLTVFFNPKYLESIGFWRDTAPSDKVEIRGQLFLRLEAVFQKQRTGMGSLFPEEIRLHWETEKGAIEFLDQARQKLPELADFLSSPVFGERHGQSATIAAKLSGFEPLLGNNESYWSTGALFTEARTAMTLLHLGKIDEAEAALPRGQGDKFFDYCRQKVAFEAGFIKLNMGYSHSSKYFIRALPLIRRFVAYENRIIGLAQEIDHDLNHLIGMDEVLQVLVKNHRSPKLLTITSYVMSYKAEALYHTGSIKAREAEGILREALRLYRENEVAAAALRKLQTEGSLDELVRNLDKGNTRKAARIAADLPDARGRAMFFDFIVNLFEMQQEWPFSTEQRLHALRHLYDDCCLVDPRHPIVDRIDRKTKDLSGKK